MTLIRRLRVIQCLCLVLAALFLSSAVVEAQDEAAVLLHRIGTTNCDDYRGSLDLLLIDLNKAPGTRGVVFVYEGDHELGVYDGRGNRVGAKLHKSEVGVAKRIIGYYEDHLRFRSFPMDRITFVEAGFQRTFATEFWLVPSGANAPKASPTLKKLKQKKRRPDSEVFCAHP